MTRPLIKLSIFAAITLVLTGLLAQTLGSLGWGGTSYRARFTDVTGVLAGDDVRIAGVKVGRVSGIALVPDGGDLVAEVTFTLDEAVTLPSTVRATIRYRNIVGQRYIALTEGPGGAKKLPGGGLIPLSQTAPALDLTVLFNGFRPLFTGLSPEEVNQFAFEIIQVLQGERGTVASLLQRTASLTHALADRDEVIGRVITNLSKVLETLGDRDDELSRAILALQQLVSGLAADREAIGQAIAGIGELAEATGSLVADVRPSLAADITLLHTLAGTLHANSETLEGTLNRLPGRYQALTRTASSGSWFNFFLCDFDGTVGYDGTTVTAPTFSSDIARCVPGRAS